MKIKREIEESLIVAWTDPSGVEHERDATPADLARGGYVRDGDTRAGLREALRARERAELDALAELDEQRARAEKAEGLLIQRETELRLAREDGDERARDLRQAYERAVAAAEKAERELATERYEHGSTLTSRDMIHNKLAQAERERDEAKAGHNAVQADLAETVHERDSLRAELARLAAPGEGEPTDEELRAVHGRACGGATADGDTRALCIARRALWRGGVAHERARQQDRATDEELFAAYQRAFVLAADEEDDIEGEPDPERLKADRVTPEERAGILAVAARVRQERCLVAQAVRMGADLHVVAHGGADERQVTVAKGRHMQRAYAAPAEVPSTLARLLGEVSRG